MFLDWLSMAVNATVNDHDTTYYGKPIVATGTFDIIWDYEPRSAYPVCANVVPAGHTEFSAS